MPIATTLPSRSITIRYPPTSTSTTAQQPVAEESYQLLELPNEILKLVEGGKGGMFPLTIKGRPSDDAVLCTPTTTFTLRTVQISNSLLILRPPPPCSSSSSSSTSTPSIPTPTPQPQLEIRDTCHEVLECVPQAAKLDRIRTVLRETQWQGLGSDIDGPHIPNRKRKRGMGMEGKKWYTREMMESVVQGSEGELGVGLKERNVVDYEGRMLLLPPKHLQPLLSIIFTLLLIHSPSASDSSVQVLEPRAECPTKPLISALSEDHDTPPALTRGIMDLFGEVVHEEKEEVWKADVRGMVREVGRGLLEGLSSEGRRKDLFEADWREAVGDTWEGLVDLKLLEGDHLLNDPPISMFSTRTPIVIPFPLHSLPLHPPTRFADLFLTRPKWRAEEMAPFLNGLYREGDHKERDKLVGKFVRVVKEKEGVWWYPRRTT